MTECRRDILHAKIINLKIITYYPLDQEIMVHNPKIKLYN